eukprot:TRINITY_DN26441_c0_g1_i1.p1 TRINITY_DN26441_c0_g1~~TRINITY_DN26441_c0_g1_i1.p1  ORF type:complete len:1124 (+),score=274.89 TRINITY_DN26441_c0_g1_i1:301-3372(+)
MDAPSRERLRCLPMKCLGARGGMDGLPASATEALLHLAAVAEKLAWAQTGEAAAAATLGQLLPLLRSADPAAAAVGGALGRAVCCEFSCSRAGLGLTWEQHEGLRTDFERLALAHIFEAGLQLLMRCGAMPEVARVQLLRLLDEGLLGWPFGPRDPSEGDGSQGDPLDTHPFRAGAEWAPVLVNPQLASQLLLLHEGGGEQQRQHAQEAWVTLCGVQGGVFDPSSDSRVRWLSSMVTHAEEFARRGCSSGCWGVLLAATRGLARLSRAHGADSWDLLPDFLQRVAALRDLTISVARHPAARQGEPRLAEALDNLLDLWAMRLVELLSPWRCDCPHSDPRVAKANQSALRSACGEVFRAFAAAHITAGPLAPQEHRQAAEEADDAHDREYAQSTHGLVALLGREDPDASLALLVSCVEPLGTQVTAAAAAGGQVPDAVQDALLAAIQVGSAVCADAAEGEVPGIPPQLARAARPHERLPSAEAEQRCGVLRFVAVLFTLCEALVALFESPQRAAASPLVLAEGLRGIARWVRSYVCPDPDANFELSTVFTLAWQEGRAAARRAVALSHRALRAAPDEAEVVAAALDVLLALAEKPPLQQWLPSPECVEWGQLCADEAQGSGPLLALPHASRRRLMEALCVGSGSRLFTALLAPLQQQLRGALDRLSGDAAADVFGSGLLLALERVRGVAASSAHAAERQAAVCGWVQDLLPVLVSLGGALADREEVSTALFDLVGDLVRAQGAFAEPAQVAPLFGAALQLCRGYAARTRGRRLQAKSAAARSAEEDARLQSLLSLTALLSSVTEWDMLGVSGDDGRRADAGDVVLEGVHYLLGLVDDSFLAHPSLELRFFALLEACLALYCDKLSLVPDAVLDPLLHCIERALGSVQQDVLIAGYRSIAALCNYCKHATQAGRPAERLQRALPYFLRKSLAAVALEPVPAYAIDPAARAVHALSALLGVDAACAALDEALAQHPHRGRLCSALAACLRALPQGAAPGRTSRLALAEWRKQFCSFVATAGAVRLR